MSQSKFDGFVLVWLLPTIATSFSIDPLAGLGKIINTTLDKSTLSFDSLTNGLSLVLYGLMELITQFSLFSNNEITAGLGFFLDG